MQCLRQILYFVKTFKENQGYFCCNLDDLKILQNVAGRHDSKHNILYLDMYGLEVWIGKR